jgi:hypothetical protein
MKMSKTRFTKWIVLACIGSVAACTSGDGGTAGNTEMNVIVPNGAPSLGGGSTAPALIDIQDIEYTIDCQGNSDTFLENAASFPDEVTLNGNLEVQDGRTNAAAVYGDPLHDGNSEVWNAFMDLPPGPCTVQLRARDNDGEVICTATEPFNVVADTSTKVNVLLICDISFQAPVGMLDLDATFSFNVGNFCPDLFILNCLDSAPAEQVVLPPPNPPLAGTGCQVRFRDGDSTCNAGCDPQTCTPTPAGIDCVPGPDPGVSTTVTCDADTLLDCNGDGVPDPSCTFTGDTIGTLEQQPPSFPGAPGNGGFFITCLPPALGGTPGATATCTAVTTDGDLDCDKTKVVDVTCPGSTPCQLYDEAQNGLPAGGGTQAGADATCDAADGTVCTVSVCDDLVCDGSTSGSCCTVQSNAPDGTDCSSEIPEAIGVCAAGVCVPDVCTSDAQCAATTPQCFVPQTCDQVVGSPTEGQCIPLSPVPSASGTSCDDGLGPLSGACDGGGTCIDICTFNPACPDDAPGIPDDSVCTAATCDPVDGTCGQTSTNEGGTCDFSGPGSADGVCASGGCIFAPPACGSQSATVGQGCTNSVTTAQSPFPYTLSVNNVPAVIGGAPFTADLDGIGIFPEFFLDAAQGVVPGGVDQAILEDLLATVQVRSGATGPDVGLTADIGALVPGPTSFCTYPPSTVCTVDGDCIVPPCQPPVNLATIPNSTDCSVGGVCDLLGKNASQCLLNGFCVTGDLVIELQEQTGIAYTAAATGPVLWGWGDTGVANLLTCPDVASTECGVAPGRIDGCYDLPNAVFSNPLVVPGSGIRVNVAGALFVAIECAGGSDGGQCASGEGCLVDGDCATAPCTGVGVDDDIICPTPDSALIACPVF